MLDFSQTSKQELEQICLKLDKSLMDTYKRANTLSSEVLLLRKENDRINEALNKACAELAKAYKKSGKTNQKWLEPKNWFLKFTKKDK